MRYYAYIDRDLLKNRDIYNISINAIVLLSIMESFARITGNKTINISNKKLAEEMKLSERHIVRCKNELIEAKLIEIEYEKNSHQKIIILHDNKIEKKSTKSELDNALDDLMNYDFDF